MGMKANGGFFKGTSGHMKYKLDIQFFAANKRPLKARLLLRIVKSDNLKNTIKELYKPGAKVGDGSTAAAIKKQLKTGVLVGGKDHLVKGRERINNLTNLINCGRLNKMDLKIAKKLRKNLERAFGGK